MIQAAVFDLDGVLIDRSEQLFQSYQHVLKKFNVEYDSDMFNQLFGLRGADHIASVLASHDIHLSDDEFHELVDERNTFYKKLIGSDVVLLPGAEAIIQALRVEGIPLALVSSTSRENIDHILPQLGLDDTFMAIVSGDDTAHGKPHPEPYIAACAELNVPPEESVGFEDTEYGVEALKGAGLCAVAVTATNRREYDFSEADLVVTSLKEVTVEQLHTLR